MKNIQTSSTLGTTCIASVFDTLKGNIFPLVILDECSQMLEPLSMLPISRFRCEKLVSNGFALIAQQTHFFLDCCW